MWLVQSPVHQARRGVASRQIGGHMNNRRQIIALSALVLASVTTVACSSSPSGHTQWGGDTAEYLREIKNDDLLGIVFADGSNDDGAIDIAEAICSDLEAGNDMIGVAIFLNDTFGWPIEVATQLTIDSNVYYCPDLDGF